MQYEFGIVIPTLNRPKHIADSIKMFLDYATSHQVSIFMLIVESGNIGIYDSFPYLNNSLFQLKIIGSPFRSSALQRNLGLKQLPGCKYVLFSDDDIRFNEDDFTKFRNSINELINLDPGRIGFAPLLSGLYIQKSFGVYSRIIYRLFFNSDFYGKFFSPGINIAPKLTDSPIEVNWFMSGFMVFKFEALQNIEFDSYFEGYSVFEDVDFTYRLFKEGGKLTIIPIVFEHLEGGYETRDWEAISKQSIINRYYVGKKFFSTDWLFKTKFFVFTFLLILIPFIFKFQKYKYHLKGIVKGLTQMVKEGVLSNKQDKP
jgi:GT2 family glycosyltransferase